ncbi:rhamnulokinase [Domibacillus indicus]|uniref:rhamnulokinase n=1 Tax=Domibacillus indicus TaxID=1437523 RepID=UPI00204238BC|nr:rhamnulokinase [Domibacillus indicus]MCM3790700.1 rhamnulokinase [Domibacillus indicus]
MIHIAVDIGASSGRLVVGDIKNEKLEIKEIHRFANGFIKKDGMCFWDIEHLLNEILKGLEQAKNLGCEVCTLGIDTWATDYVLVDENGNRFQEVISYRDKRTEETIEKVAAHLPQKIIYEKTGIQFLSFNTLYQLYEETPENLSKTKFIMTVPDYLGFCLTGIPVTEITNASATQLLNIHTGDFDEDLLVLLGISRNQFPPLTYPGRNLGHLLHERFPSFDLPITKIITVASHDTASAIAGSPGQGNNWAYVSSGTWSLIGVENEHPVITDLTRENNYTNEWGAFGTYRFLKNIMGMWIIQEVRKHLPQDFNFEQLVIEARKEKNGEQFVDFNEDRFLNPENMIEEIQQYCRETNQKVPQTAGELANCIFTSLAVIYAASIEQVEEMNGREIEEIYIVGGGAQNDLINELTAQVSGKTVYAGPFEATAIGNLLIQLIAEKEVKDLQAGRQLIRHSFNIKKYRPVNQKDTALLKKFKEIASRREILKGMS